MCTNVFITKLYFNMLEFCHDMASDRKLFHSACLVWAQHKIQMKTIGLISGTSLKAPYVKNSNKNYDVLLLLWQKLKFSASRI